MQGEQLSYQDFLRAYRACRNIDLRNYTAENLRTVLVRHFQGRSPGLAARVAGLGYTSMQLLYTYLCRRRENARAGCVSAADPARG